MAVLAAGLIWLAAFLALPHAAQIDGSGVFPFSFPGDIGAAGRLGGGLSPFLDGMSGGTSPAVIPSSAGAVDSAAEAEQ